MRLCLLLITVWVISSSVILVPTVRPVFGVRVSIGANSSITTFACFIDNGKGLTSKRIVDPETFIKIASGYWPTKYNPKKINYFEENGIDCGIYFDSLEMKKIPSCVPLDSLWKIRFATYPFKGNVEMGWSNKYHKPAPKQEMYLHDRYGINHIDGDFFLDTSFWMLLNDVMDPIWIENYKAIE
tara:strand:- start:3571 stop:4122 length:552 start_codon:yes stop_codon:yes gene_type:complete